MIVFSLANWSSVSCRRSRNVGERFLRNSSGLGLARALRHPATRYTGEYRTTPSTTPLAKISADVSAIAARENFI